MDHDVLTREDYFMGGLFVCKKKEGKKQRA